MSKISENKEFDPWSLSYGDYDPKKEKSRETLLAIGNGYFGSRGALEETVASDTNYPGTYIAGLYNRLVSKVADKDIENEDFVNCPNWTAISFRIEGGKWLDVNNTEIVSISRKLDFKTGLLSKIMVVKDKKGRTTEIKSSRFASMENRHLAAIQYRIKPLDYKGKIEIKSGLDGNIKNDGVERYRDLEQQQLKPELQGVSNENLHLLVKTVNSNIEIAETAKHQTLKNGIVQKPETTVKVVEGKAEQIFEFQCAENDELTLEKIVAIATSKADDVDNPEQFTHELIEKAESFQSLFAESETAWQKIWDTIDIQIGGDTKSQMLVRLHLYHLMVTASPNNQNIDFGIPARGLHGEAYRGHIFWDELYILPLYNMFFPEVAKSVLLYRYRRIEKAREYAKEYGYKGAMFPWQSGSDGREETQIIHLNPVSGKWGDDYSSLQRHISIAIAYNTWHYFHVTDDVGFMENAGAEMFLEICRFWASKAECDKESGRFSISKVMGPDEFHEQHPASKGGGVKNNAYTNIMVAWLFGKATEILGKMHETAAEQVKSKIDLQDNELESWKNIAENIDIPVSEKGIIEQFEGYFDLKELDWDAYRKKYGNIHRLDRILKAEGKSPDDYKLAKQADTLMTFYNLDKPVVTEILEKAGHRVPENYLQKNYDYYLARTSHGSTLSRVVHSYLANMFGNKEEGVQLYLEALESDFTDIQGGTTAEGIHAGVMGGTVLMAITSYAGVNLKNDVLAINPSLPEKWGSLAFKFNFRACRYHVKLTHNKAELLAESDIYETVIVNFTNKKIILPTGKKQLLDY